MSKAAAEFGKTRRQSGLWDRRRWFIPILALVGALSVFPRVPASAAEPPGTDPFSPGRWDAGILAAGGLLSATGTWILDPREREVPPGGLDRSGISIAWDRRTVASPRPGALSASNGFLLGTAAMPGLWAWATAPRETRGGIVLETAALQLEASTLALGAALVLKSAISRPRPFTYLEQTSLPAEDAYDLERGTPFESFPSGHAAVAWASVITGASTRARLLPEASATTHFLAGCTSGALATTTSLLRIHGGQHFPTDIAGGAALGITCGVGISWLRGTSSPVEGTAKAWKSELFGMVVGSALAFLLTPPTSPLID